MFVSYISCVQVTLHFITTEVKIVITSITVPCLITTTYNLQIYKTNRTEGPDTFLFCGLDIIYDAFSATLHIAMFHRIDKHICEKKEFLIQNPLGTYYSFTAD